MRAPALQQGFTLLEALVALVVISIGLLGLLGLQTVAIVNTHVSKSQTMASIAADDMADRIRVNPAATASLIYADITAGAPAQPATDCSQTVCDPAAMAQYDDWEWQQMLSRTLQNGRGEVSCASPSSPASGNPCLAYNVTVLWHGQDAAAGSGSGDVTSCPSGGSGSGSGSGSDSSVRCYSIEIQP